MAVDGVHFSAWVLFKNSLSRILPLPVVVRYVYVEKLICCKLFIVSDLCKNICIEIVVLDLNFVRIVESCSTVWLSIALLMVHVKKNGKLFLFLGSNVFCKLANLLLYISQINKACNRLTCGVVVFSS